jgi:hypothetical protein
LRAQKEKPLKRRPVRLVLAAVGLVALTPLLPASAHVRAGVPGGELQAILFRAPVEGGPDLVTRHNQALIMDFAPGFTVQKCHATVDFSCAITTLQAIWTRRANSTTFAPFDVFRVDVRTPAVANLLFDVPATQIYSDGEIVKWNETDQLAPHPAPQLRVITEFDKVQPLVTQGAFLALPGTTLKIAGTATLTRTATQTLIAVDVSGLDPNTIYPSHLHDGTCAELGGHYMNDPAGPAAPPNELWPSSDPADPAHGLTTDADGHVVGTGTADWVARPSARAVVLHSPGETGGGGGGGGGPHTGHLLAAAAADPHAGHVMIACADLR